MNRSAVYPSQWSPSCVASGGYTVILTSTDTGSTNAMVRDHECFCGIGIGQLLNDRSET